jgi:hypothetical protein
MKGNSMTATVKHGYAVALFDTFGQAEHAMRVLSQRGCSAVDCRCVQRGDERGPTELDIAVELDRVAVPPDQKSIYQYEFDAGRVLMVVEVHDRVDEIETILNDCGALNVNVREAPEPLTEEHQYPFAETEHTTPNQPR